MKFTIERNKLAEAVTSAAQGLPGRPASPIEAGMLVSVLGEIAQFTASDGFTTYNCITDAETQQDGRFIFPRVFTEMVKTFSPGEIEISVENFIATIAGGKARFTCLVLPGGDFPLPPLDLPLLGEMDGPGFRMALRKVLPAVDRDNATPVLTTVRVEVEPETLTFVTAHHYSIAVSECHLEEADCDHVGKVFLVPGTVVEKVARMDGAVMSVGLDKGRVQFRSGGFTITCPQTEGEFPKGWDIILSLGEQWTRLPQGLADAVRRASLTLGEKEAVSLYFAAPTVELPGELVVSTDGNKGGFTEVFDFGDYQGPPVTVKVGASLLKDALAYCDEIAVEKSRPLVFRGRNCRFLVQIRREA